MSNTSDSLYPEIESIRRLIAIGDWLNAEQTGRETERDDTGLNGGDHERWSTHPPRTIRALRGMLRKYQRQIIDRFGSEEYILLGLDLPTASAVVPKADQGSGRLWLNLDGKVGPKSWPAYIDAHKALKTDGVARFDFDLKTWYVPAEKVSVFAEKHLASYRTALAQIEIEVMDFQMPARAPQAELALVESRPVKPQISADEVINGILGKRIYGGYIAVRREADGRFAFYAPFSKVFNDIFSNKTGKLTGITEYNPSTHARETFDLNLVEEAIIKLGEAIPNWQIVTSGVDEARIAKNAENAELSLPIPEVQAVLNPDFSLFRYQNEGVRFMQKNDGCIMNGADMGLGKTLMTLAWVASASKRVLVVVPKVVRRTWCQEAVKFFPTYFAGKTVELISKDIKKYGQPDLRGANLASVNYESLAKFLPAILASGIDTIVIDESHRMKSPSAQITKTIQSLRDRFRHRMLLSGTMVKNRKDELHQQVEFVRPGLFQGRAELRTGTIGGVFNTLRSTCYIAWQKKDVLKDLPEKLSQIVEIEVQGMPKMPEDIGEQSAAKVAAAMAKAEATAEFIREIIADSDSCVLAFSDSVEAAKRIAADLGNLAILHHGQMSDDSREAAKAEFQRPDSPKRVFVSTRQSLAVGATLTRADKVVFNDLPWTAADIRQAEDRAHRIGQKNTVNVYWISAQGSAWDHNLNFILRRKYELHKKINEGKQVTEAEREWMDKPVTIEEVTKGAKI